jgi:hypothetical protein
VVKHDRARLLQSYCNLAGTRRYTVGAQVLVGDWRTEYNTYRPHSALDGLTPADYAEQWKQTNQPGSAAVSAAPVGRQRDGAL